MLSVRERRPGNSAGRFYGKKIRVAFQAAAVLSFVAGFLSCGPGDPVPSNSGATQNFSAAVKSPVKTVPVQNVPTPPSPQVERILSRHALYLSDLQFPRSDLGPQEQEERSQRQEVLDRILNEPDPEVRQILITWSKSTLENDSEAVQIIKELKSYDGDNPDTDPFSSEGSLNNPAWNTTAGETGG
jgi:hypothetical protein